MENVKKPEIEAIFPLSYMQEGLLFHHLSSSLDQGLLYVECTLKGALQVDYFKKAWDQTVKRHSVLRSTVHWKNLKKPLQLVHPEQRVNWKFFDWSSHTAENKKQKLEKLKQTDRQTGINFENAPLLNVIIIQMEPQNFCLLWRCHHLLLDGWSSSNILQDVFTYYNAFCDNTEPVLEHLPPYKSYLKWLKSTDEKAAKLFWKTTFDGFGKSFLFQDAEKQKLAISNIAAKKIKLSKSATTELSTFAKHTKVTLNTVLQGLWTMLLCRYFDTDDVVYGTTVSGRSGDFPNMELLSGMFMNVQPVRNVLDKNNAFVSWFKEIQKVQQQARNFEHINLDQISEWVNQPAAAPIFDSLLIFENFPWRLDKNNHLEVSDFKSGITSTYPLTIVVVPGGEIEIKLLVDTDIINEVSADWLITNLEKLIEHITNGVIYNYNTLLTHIHSPEAEGEKSNVQTDKKELAAYVAPRNKTELQLVKIWEETFHKHPIGIHDNFFAIGGKSLLAVKMFGTINKELNEKLQPTLLMEHPTIASIASFINNQSSEQKQWKYVVPIRTRGKKEPLFCIHAGGGHVFFYNLLPEFLDPERPVYALQPLGIDGEEGMHSSIEEMTADYLKEIRMIQAHGPYNIMVYCFSTAIGIEMLRLLKPENEKMNFLVIDTMAEQENLFKAEMLKVRVLSAFERFRKKPFRAFKLMISDRYDRYIKPSITKLSGNRDEKTLQLLKTNLISIYKKYKWSKFEGKVSLILTDKDNNALNDELISSWRELASEEIDIVYTKGHHRTLFESPDVEFIAEKIEKCITNNN